MQMRGTITSGNDIYFYFEMLRQLSPKRVLDVGMFLKRIGAVSRQAMATELSSQIQLCGVDLFSEVPLPIYEQIYNEVLEKESFFLQQTKTFATEKFDVAVALRVGELLAEQEKETLYRYLLQSVGGILTDAAMAVQMKQRGAVRGFYPVNIENDQYAWIPVAELRGEL